MKFSKLHKECKAIYNIIFYKKYYDNDNEISFMNLKIDQNLHLIKNKTVNVVTVLIINY